MFSVVYAWVPDEITWKYDRKTIWFDIVTSNLFRFDWPANQVTLIKVTDLESQQSTLDLLDWENHILMPQTQRLSSTFLFWYFSLLHFFFCFRSWKNVKVSDIASLNAEISAQQSHEKLWIPSKETDIFIHR